MDHDYKDMTIDQLFDRAKSGDIVARNYLQVAVFNRKFSPGDKVIYRRQGYECKCFIYN